MVALLAMVGVRTVSAVSEGGQSSKIHLITSVVLALALAMNAVVQTSVPYANQDINLVLLDL